jgi:arginine decarboxylase
LAKPVSRILVINDEPLVLREIVKGLNAAARSLENPCGITFSGVTTAREALGAIESDGDIQSVLVDDKLYSLPARARRNGANSGNRRNARLQMSALELVQRITRFRPELDVYILIAQEKEDDVVDALFTEAVDGYFYREEARPPRASTGFSMRRSRSAHARRSTDQLKSYVWMAKDQWHTPGHSSGESLRGSPWVNDFYDSWASTSSTRTSRSRCRCSTR